MFVPLTKAELEAREQEAKRAISLTIGRGKTLLSPVESIALAGYVMGAIDRSRSKTFKISDIRERCKQVLFARGVRVRASWADVGLETGGGGLQ